MGEAENVKVVQRMFDAWNAHDVEAFVRELDPETRWESESMPASLAGHEGAITEFQALAAFFEGSTPTVYSQIVVTIAPGDNRSMVRTLSFIDTVCVDVPDGTDTYVIKGGKIVSLTTHGFFVFCC